MSSPSRCRPPQYPMRLRMPRARARPSAETVQRFGGFVAKYMGDGVLVYLGYPQAHEDDAERAVRAGLELVAAVGAPTECPRSLRYSTATSAPYAVGKPRAARALPATRVPHLARKQRRIGEELCHCSPD
jgi:hypothetical protein